MKTTLISTVITVVTLGMLADSAEARTRLIFNVVGMDEGRDANTANGEPADATCFDVDLRDPHTGRTIGTATDCLGNLTPVGGGVALVGTTFFKLPRRHDRDAGQHDGPTDDDECDERAHDLHPHYWSERHRECHHRRDRSLSEGQRNSPPIRSG